jgi:uncharacterized protein
VVRLTPKGGRDAINGIDRMADGTKVLKVRVAAAPRDVALIAGATARLKRLAILGHGPTLAAALEKIAAPR